MPPAVSKIFRRPADRAWLVVLATYVVVYGGLLWATDGYPYVFDNNESYSSLWHARSLYENGVAQTKGLTDEVFSPSPAASPYIHSHQGNFPRLFTFILYALGLRTIGPQIWVTTFTVGLAALWFAFRFFSRLINPVYAALTCLVLMTDYLFFTQWQVGLYNIWHGFFFFSSLLCVQSLGTVERRGRWFALALLNFAALFYWEYVFTAFVALLCGLYAVVLYWRRFRLVWLVAAAGAAGAALAAGLLLAQLTAYMGWANVMEDVRLTLTARNAAADPVLLERVTSFYREHRIIFWHNFMDAAPLRTLAALWASLLEFHLKYYSPALLYAATVLLAGWMLGGWRWFGGILGGTPAAPAPGLPRGTTLRPLAADVVKVLLTAACLTGLLKSFYSSGSALLSLAAAVLSLATALLLGRFWTGLWWGWHRIGWLRFIPMCLLVVIAVWTGQWTAEGLDPSLQEEFLRTSGGPAIVALSPTWLLLITGLALSSAVTGNESVLGRLPVQRLAGLLPFLLCGLIAYGVTYRLFTGYIYSGYLHRFVPLTVFLTAPLLGLASYLVVQPLIRSIRPGWLAMASLPTALRHLFGATLSRQREQAAVHSASTLVRALPLALGLAAISGLAGWWVLLQTTYARVAPADTYSFLAQLERPPFKGRSLVTNVYPAPMAARTGSWGYADTSLFSGILRLDPDGYKTEHDLKYLWFADRDTNPSYLKPDLAITFIQTSNFNEARDRYQEWQSARPGDPPRVESTSLFKRAREPFQPFMHYNVAATDGRRYSIVRLDWDFPPYLAPQDSQIQELARQLNLQQKLALSAASQDVARRWRVELDLLDSPADADAIELTGDGLPVALTGPAVSGPLTVVINADRLNLRLGRSPQGGRVRVTVNAATETFDLRTLATAEADFTWSAGQPLGKYTSIPRFTPGFYLRTGLLHAAGRPLAELTYRYVHQEGAPEAATTVRLYAEDAKGHWHLADTVRFLGPLGVPIRLAEFRRANPETISEHSRLTHAGDLRTYEQWLADHLTAHPDEWTRTGIVQEGLPGPLAGDIAAGASTVRRLPLPAHATGRFQYSVSPGTRTKAGPEYFGLPFFANAFTAKTAATVAFVAPAAREDAFALPYGRLHLKLKFPANRWPQAEPLLVTGSNEAGDIVYVIYSGPGHIRLGFDHWFKGGPVTKPIPIDFTREHDLEISVGSLYPAAEDIVFVGRSADELAAVKNRVVIKLDGQTVIDSEGTAYDSSPSQVILGRNSINATSCGLVFTGEIRSVERIWPWPN